MGEINLVVDRLKLTYAGIFDFAELHKIFQDWSYEKGGVYWPFFDEESITPTGKQINLKAKIWKNIVEEVQIGIEIRIHGVDCKEVEVDIDGTKRILLDGHLGMELDGYVKTDRHGWWGRNPFHWFLNYFIGRIVLKNYYTLAERWLITDLEQFYAYVKSYLNVSATRYKRGTIVPWAKQ